MDDAIPSLGRYLRARRDALRPEEVGLRPQPGRRVRGLRRQEVAQMAGISPDYYLRLEQGRDRQPSAQVLLALVRALRLDADAAAYLFRLAGHAPPSPGRTEGPWAEEEAGDEAISKVLTFLDRWTSAPAYVLDRNQDVVAINTLGRMFFPLALRPGVNALAAIVDGALAATEDHEYWDGVVREMTAALRFHADPADARFQLLVAALAERSAVFRETWESHEARPRRGGVAPVFVEPFGYLPFQWQTLEIPGGGQFLTTFFGEDGSVAAAALEYLGARLRLDGLIAQAGEDAPAPLHPPSVARPAGPVSPGWSSWSHDSGLAGS